MTTRTFDRREFLGISGTVGAGLLIGFRVLDAETLGAVDARAADFSPNAYLRVGSDGIITLFADHVELGQGVTTALPMIVAEELDADWSMVRVERMPADPSAWPRRIQTVGSQSVRTSWAPLRKAGATAREMLISAAAASWAVDRAECRAENGSVVHAASGRRASYGSLANAAASLPVPTDAPLKDPKSFRIVGTKRARVDIPSKTNGSAQFGIDVRVPGMLVATVIRSPVLGGTVKSFDATAAKAMPGVKDVVQFESGLAVLAADTWSALKGRNALKVEWDAGPNAALTSAEIRRQFTAQLSEPGKSAANKGDVAAALAGATNVVNADYELPFAAHATMEPMNCTAHVRADGVDVWVPTQSPTSFQATAAQIVGVSPSAVKLHVTMVGGGFGRRARPDVLQDAVRLSKLVGAPVKVLWTREDDMQHDFYRPFGLHRMSGAVGADGMPIAWTHRIVTQNALSDGDTVGGAADLPYLIPNLRVELIVASSAVPVAPWRSVGHSQNGFVTESFLDELAFAGKQDPVALRRKLLANAPRYLGVMELAVSNSDWGKPMPAGSGRGIAVHAMTGSYVAQIAEVSVVNNVITVNKVICAVDCGVVINPDTLAAQMEGSIIYGLTCALKNEITVNGGKIEQANFNTYPMLRMSEAPRVEVHTVQSGEAPGGIGEPGVPPIAAAVANAVFAATGKRLRKLPFRLG
jgi:isoquinoline 1-oxidoreductase beta subunit